MLRYKDVSGRPLHFSFQDADVHGVLIWLVRTRVAEGINMRLAIAYRHAFERRNVSSTVEMFHLLFHLL